MAEPSSSTTLGSRPCAESTATVFEVPRSTDRTRTATLLGVPAGPARAGPRLVTHPLRSLDQGTDRAHAAMSRAVPGAGGRDSRSTGAVPAPLAGPPVQGCWCRSGRSGWQRARRRGRNDPGGQRRTGREGGRAGRLLPGDGRLVPRRVRHPHLGATGSVDGDLPGGAHARRRPDRFREDPGRLPVGIGHAGHLAWRRRRGGGLPGALRVAAEGAGRGRGTQPAHPAGRDRADGPPVGSGPTGDQGGHPDRGHAAGGAAGLRAPSPRRAGHHPGVPVPAAHLAGPGVAARRHHGHPRRGARPGWFEARRPPGAVPGTPRRAAPGTGAAHRPLRDGPAHRGGGGLPGGRPAGPGGHARRPETDHGDGRGAGRRHDRARRRRTSPGWPLHPRGGGSRPGGGFSRAGGRLPRRR